MTGPLSDVTILDLTSVISGPLATSILADQGARVIKVESPSGDSMRRAGAIKGGVSSLFSSINRNKESIALDLRKPEAIEIINKIAAQADVCIQNYRPGVVEKLGIGYEHLKRINPELIYASISGVGSEGPYSHRRFYDPVIQAYAGFASAQTVNGEPGLVKMMICDKVTSLTMSQAITAALYDRKNTSKGQHVEVSMLEASLYFIWPDRMLDQSFVDIPDSEGGDLTARYQAVPTRDGHITFMTLQLDEFHGLARAIGKPEWTKDPRFLDLMSMYTHYGDIYEEMFEQIGTWETAPLVERLASEDVPFGVVLDPDNILLDPQIQAHQIIRTFEDSMAGTVRHVNRNSRFSSHDTGIRSPAPRLGEHAKSILTEFGYSEADIEPLQTSGVVL
ncbi:MAG: CaiB/BaiF CoA transferase family protein [Candidatus Azotimanducaceae bacterium WSBS_2022_MAG_OTU7]